LEFKPAFFINHSSGFTALYQMNYHSNLLPAQIREFSSEKETVLIESYVARRKFYLFLKRAFDIFFSLAFIVGVLSWLLPITSFLILFDSRGPVFFVQRRMGKNGRTFSCLKLRTMIINDEANEKQADENDYRITRIGKFLRRTNIDEFPQFINVLIGDMSIIGPRPHMFSDCTRFSFVIPAYKFRTLMRPGITGLAQVKGYHGPTADYESIFTRYHWDAEYIRNARLGLDVKIIAVTFFQSLGNLVYMLSSFFGKL
jgi:putative colanic acid biosynthesis UDP-glucose lipid carrier transferase